MGRKHTTHSTSIHEDLKVKLKLSVMVGNGNGGALSAGIDIAATILSFALGKRYRTSGTDNNSGP